MSDNTRALLAHARTCNTSDTMDGDELRAIREALGLTQLELGNQIGKRERTISAWETGESPVPTVTAIALRLLYRERREMEARK